MDNNRNVITAIVLSFAILFLWQILYAGPKMEEERARLAAQQAQQTQVTTPPGVATQPGQPTGQPGATAPAALPGVPTSAGAAPTTSIPQGLASGERIRIETPELTGSINLRGGLIDDLSLKAYRQTIDPESPLVRLFEPGRAPGGYFADFGWVNAAGGTAPVPGPDTLWTASAPVLSPGAPLTLTWDNGQGLVFTRTIAIDDHYMFTVTQGVRNTGAQPVTLHPYGLVNRFGEPQVANNMLLHEGLIGVLGEEGLQEVDYDDLEAPITVKSLPSGWLGITDKYWASALIPRAAGFDADFVRSVEAGGVPKYQADFVGAPVAVPAGGGAESQALLFAGAKEVDLLDGYQAALGIDRFELLIDWGWFHFLTRPMFLTIDWLYRFLGNFGLAILAVTVIVKLIFFPLANKSYASMSKMKKLQPEVMALQERFKDDRMAMQKELMELYKRDKINPLAGCWPILIQIPVFFALYKVLFITIEMRHAPFFGWIRDLSAPDPTSIFNLFGLLPYDVPAFLQIGVWPLIMGLTMFVQMRLNPTPPDKTQAMIFNWMPVVFTFMLASFPAGLVIYWAWNNFLSILQQALIMKRHGTKIELWDNLVALFRKPKNEPAE